MKRVLVFGAFDVIHPGHRSFLKQAREHGDYLIVSVARDSFIITNKGRRPIHTEDVRRQYVLATGLVDEAYLGDEVPGTYAQLREIKPDVVCVGYDQEEFKRDIAQWLATHDPHVELVTLDPFEPDRYKSSKLNAEAYRAMKKTT